MSNIGMSELIVILIIALLVFGPEKLPKIARSVGRAIYKFKQELNSFQEKIDEEVSHPKEPSDKPVPKKK